MTVCYFKTLPRTTGVWSGGAMVLGKLTALLLWISVGQGPTMLATGTGGVV